jgi:cyclophilin family peptidyl-prolyl cis-trans isomerase
MSHRPWRRVGCVASRRRRRLAPGALALLGGAVLLAACSSSTSPPSSGKGPSTTIANASAPTTTSTTSAASVGTTTSADCPAVFTAKLTKPSWSHAPAMTINTAHHYTATITTDVGTMTVRLEPKLAPVTVNNFVFLAENHFFDCIVFHRVIPGFVNQTGDPTGTGTGGPGYTIPDEFPKKASNPARQYPLDSLAMANTGSPHTGGSQFFIVAGPDGESLPNSYSLFGQVTSGTAVVDKINADGNANPQSGGVPPKVLHRMISVRITES